MLVLGCLGLFFGAALALGGKFFKVKVDPRQDRINELLPGANCGACGFSGCLACAGALVGGQAEPSACPVCAPAPRREIARLLGRQAVEEEPPVARIFCRGGHESARRYLYQGLNDCAAANQIGGGVSACDFGCLRYYSCVKACPFDAIGVDRKGNPVVDEEKCRSCRVCVSVCPRHLISMVPRRAAVDIRCSSLYGAREVVKVCRVGCIACGKCVRACPEGAIVIENNVARIDYAKCTLCGSCLAVCPRGIIEKGPLR